MVQALAKFDLPFETQICPEFAAECWRLLSNLKPCLLYAIPLSFLELTFSVDLLNSSCVWFLIDFSFCNTEARLVPIWTSFWKLTSRSVLLIVYFCWKHIPIICLGWNLIKVWCWCLVLLNCFLTCLVGNYLIMELLVLTTSRACDAVMVFLSIGAFEKCFVFLKAK